MLLIRGQMLMWVTKAQCGGRSAYITLVVVHAGRIRVGLVNRAASPADKAHDCRLSARPCDFAHRSFAMRFRISTIALAVAATLPSLASAVDFSYSGFSTAAYAQTDTDEAQVGYSGQPNGIDSDGSFGIDSKLGVQVTAKFNEMVSATVQGVAYADLTGDWEPHLDWAYVRVAPLSN